MGKKKEETNIRAKEVKNSSYKALSLLMVLLLLFSVSVPVFAGQEQGEAPPGMQFEQINEQNIVPPDYVGFDLEQAFERNVPPPIEHALEPVIDPLLDCMIYDGMIYGEYGIGVFSQERPEILSPTHNQQIPRLEDFLAEWTAISGATHYLISLRNIDTNIAPWQGRNVGNRISYTIPSDLLIPGHRYRVAVAAVVNGEPIWNLNDRYFSVQNPEGSVTIQYRGNGHTGGTVPANQTVRTPGSEYLRGPGNMIRSGHVFGGWLDPQGFIRQPGTPVSWSFAAQGTWTMYAVWHPIQQTGLVTILYFCSAVPELMPNSYGVVTPGSVILRAPSTRVGYTFNGWRCAINFNIWQPNMTAIWTEPVTGLWALQALWTRNAPTLSVNPTWWEPVSGGDSRNFTITTNQPINNVSVWSDQTWLRVAGTGITRTMTADPNPYTHQRWATVTVSVAGLSRQIFVNQAAATRLTTSVPRQPSVSSTTSNSLTVHTINAPAGWITEYRIRLAPNGAWGAWQRSTTFSGLAAATFYQVQARFYAINQNTHVHSDVSLISANIRTAALAAQPPTTPGTPRLTRLLETSVSIEWEASRGQGNIMYHVYTLHPGLLGNSIFDAYKPGELGVQEDLIAHAYALGQAPTRRWSGSGTSATITGLNMNECHFIVVRAEIGGRSSAFSNHVRAPRLYEQWTRNENYARITDLSASRLTFRVNNDIESIRILPLAVSAANSWNAALNHRIRFNEDSDSNNVIFASHDAWERQRGRMAPTFQTGCTMIIVRFNIILNMRFPCLGNEHRSTLTHEFGHVLGLSDPYNYFLGLGALPVVMCYGRDREQIFTPQFGDVYGVRSIWPSLR